MLIFARAHRTLTGGPRDQSGHLPWSTTYLERTLTSFTSCYVMDRVYSVFIVYSVLFDKLYWEESLSLNPDLWNESAF